MKTTMLLLISFALMGCAPAYQQLTNEGAGVAYMGSELVQALPGRPIDKCKIIGHLTTGSSNRCYLTADLRTLLRNQAGKLGANLVIMTNLIDTGRECFYQAQGIAVLCDPDVLEAAGVGKTYYENNPGEGAVSDDSLPSGKKGARRRSSE